MLDTETPATETESESKEEKKKQYPPIREVYTTKNGDCLVGVAFTREFIDAGTILEHPENEDLKNKLETENIERGAIGEGTVIQIPEQNKGWFSDVSGKLKLIKSSRNQWFALKLVTVMNQPLKKVTCLFKSSQTRVIYREKSEYDHFDSLTFKGETDDNGIIIFKIPPNLKMGEFIIWPYGGYDKRNILRFLVEFGSIDHEGTIRGDRKRLANKGALFVDTASNNELSDELKEANTSPQIIIPPENYIQDDQRPLLSLCMLETIYDFELKEILKTLKKENNAKQKDVEKLNRLNGKRWEFTQALFSIRHKIETLRIQSEITKEALGQISKGKAFEESYRFNNAVRSACLETMTTKPDKQTLKSLIQIMPLPPFCVSLLGGITFFERELEREKKNLDQINNKLERTEEYLDYLLEHKAYTGEKIALLEKQIEDYNNASDHRDGLILLGKIGDGEPLREVITLISNHPDLGPEGRYIISAEINSDKKFHEIPENTEICLNPETIELLWDDMEPKKTKGLPFNIPGYTAVLRRSYQIRFDRKPKPEEEDGITVLRIPSSPIQPLFVYADSIGGPVRNGAIAYAAFNENGDAISETPSKPPVMFPAGYGITDSHGRLMKTASLSTLTDSFAGAKYQFYSEEEVSVKQDEAADTEDGQNTEMETPITGFFADSENRLVYTGSDSIALKDLKNELEQQNAEGDFNRPTLNYFDYDMIYAFLAWPASNGYFRTKPLTELAETTAGPENKPVVSKGLPENIMHMDGSLSGPLRVGLFCPLPQWEPRIREQIAETMAAVNHFEEAKQPHYRNIFLLSEMEHLTEMNLKYPFWAQDEENIRNKEELVKSLDSLQDYMRDRIENPEKSDYDNEPDIFHLRGLKESVRTELIKLRKMLECEELKAEFRAWFTYIQKVDSKTLDLALESGSLFPPGPYMEVEETREFTLFGAIIQAYEIILRFDEAYGFNDKDLQETLASFYDEISLNKNLVDCLTIPAGGFGEYQPGTEMVQQLNELITEIQNTGKAGVEEMTTLPSIILAGYNDYMDTVSHTIEATLAETDSDKGKNLLNGFFRRLTSSPGPPSLLEVFINRTGPFWVNRAITLRKSSGSARFFNITLPILFLKTASVFGAEPDSERFKTAQKSVIQTLEQPKIRNKANSPIETSLSFYKNHTEIYRHPVYKNDRALKGSVFRPVPLGNSIYKSFLILMNISCIVGDLKGHKPDAEKKGTDTVEEMVRSVATWGDIALQGHSAALLAARISNIKPSALIVKSASFLAGLSSALTAYLYWKETERLIEENADAKRIIESRFNMIANTGISVSFAIRALSRVALKTIARHGILQSIAAVVAGACTGALEVFIVLEFLYFLYSTRQFIADKTYKITHGTTALAVHLFWEKFSEIHVDITKDMYDHNRSSFRLPYYNSATRVTKEMIIEAAWGKKITDLIKKIEDIHDTTLLTNLDWDVCELEKEIDAISPGISWSPLSWHAVVPLYESGMDPDFIEKIVMIPKHIAIDEKRGQIGYIQLFNEEENKAELYQLPEEFLAETSKIDYIDSVEKLIAFYDEYKNNTEMLDYKIQGEPDDYVSVPLESIAARVVAELRTGTFLPLQYMAEEELRFEGWKRWALATFEEPPKREGQMELEPLVRTINELKTEIDRLETEAKNKRTDEIVAMLKENREKNFFYNKAFTYAVVATPFIKGSRAAGNFATAGFRNISMLLVFQGEDKEIRVKKKEAEEQLNKLRLD